MSNLLEKAKIILTPTAYDNSKVLCAKPSEPPYGDFDFSRNSAATRVNAQGLVENVQILSSNLVQNGDFSEEGVQEISNGSFSQEGSELITNGDFSNGSTGWSLGTGWSILEDKAISDGVSSNSNLVTSSAFYSGSLSVKMTINVTDYVSGGLKIYLSSTNFTEITANGDYTFYTTADRADGKLYLKSVNFIGSIDNVSVREVGQDWALETGWSIAEDKAVSDGTQTSSSDLTQSLSTPSGKSYKITYTISEYTSGSIFVRLNSGNITTPQSSVGTFTEYISGEGGTQIILRADANFNGSITNISVKEVGQNWNFDANWSIGNNKAISTGVGRMFQSIPFLEANVGTKVKVSFDIVDYTSAGVVINCYGGVSSLFQGVGSYSFITTTTDTLNLYVNNAGQGNLVGSITNLSVIAITEDTNLPRINYEGFSYQDVLGSEEVVNGTFDDGENDWDFGGDWTLVNGTAEILTSTNSFLIQANVVDLSVKTYKLQYEVISTNGSNFRLAGGNSAFGTVTLDSATIGVKTVYLTSNGTQAYLQFNQNAFRGSIDNVSVKEYLGQEVVPDSGCGSWLFEPQTTQLLTYSEDFSQWIAGGSTTIESGYLAPDGTNNAYKVSGAGSALSLAAGLTATTTRSIYARTVSGTGQANLCSYNSNTNNLFTITEEWQRFDVNSANAIGVTTFYAVDFRGGTTLSEIILWGANATNDQDYATSYVPSNGSTVTRNQDLCTGSGSVSLINSTEGTLYAEIARDDNDGASGGIQINSGSVDNSLRLFFNQDDTVSVITKVGGSNNVVKTARSITSSTAMNKFALVWKLNDYKFYYNGTELWNDTSASVYPVGTLNNLEFKNQNVPFNGKTKCLAVFPYLTDAELTALTTI